jgi:uncharacterized repeat protein (TIGR01451 family)
MKRSIFTLLPRLLWTGLALFCGLLLASSWLSLARNSARWVHAAPIEPPEGYPKFSQSHMTVTPDLVNTGGATIEYRIEIVNTGGFTGTNVTLTDTLPENTTYISSESSASPAPAFVNGVLSWVGTVGFDSTVVITLTVDVLPGFEGLLTNTAEISHATLTSPVIISADAMVTDDPFFDIEKTSVPAIPGPNKPLTYTLSITNRGQPATNLPVTVADVLPVNTTFRSAGQGGSYNPGTNTVTWGRSVNLGTGESEKFVFSVNVGDVLSGTVLYNSNYQVSNPLSGIAAGEIYTVTVLDPILFLYKETIPFPPGSNREVVYQLTVLNKGSLATNLQIVDTIPAGVTYVSGGTRVGNTVRWTLPRLDSGESAQVSFTAYIGDVAEVPILNDNYQVCSAEGICQVGVPLTSIVKGPTFEAYAFVDPIAKKPGGGGGPVTPTLTIQNLGPGYALNATATLYFERISVSLNDMKVVPNAGSLSNGPECGDKCVAYRWMGNVGVGEVITFTTIEGQSTIGGEEGTIYTATVVISDTLGAFSSEPITATATGKVTHFANLIPEKDAPPVIGAGQNMTYTIHVFNSGLSTDVPPYPTLTDTVPASTTLLSVGQGGTSSVISGTTIVSWTLPAMSPGDRLSRSYSVQVDDSLISGSLIVNDNYRTAWYDIGASITQTFVLSNTGEPITTVVKEVGLIDSYKTVTPTLALPGDDYPLTFVIHVANTSPAPLAGVQVHDLLPWQSSTYQRDAEVSSGAVISDIVSIAWTGDLEPFSEELITFTVLVDPWYQGALTNTAYISHTSLLDEVAAQAVAYITKDPVLHITKTASPSPVPSGSELLYTLLVSNLGQQATELVVTDTLPANTTFVPYSASGNGQFSGNQARWSFPVLPAGEQQELTFRVHVSGYEDIVNSGYRVSSAEGVSDVGEPVITKVTGLLRLFLPVIVRR